ncbi:flavin reductase family protein [Microbacterium rhizomatis]|nr:flavin reductase family protein [Microbacterium rhizomatis]
MNFLATEELRYIVVHEATSVMVGGAAMRETMALFGTGLTVVTGMSGDGPVGFTLQAFSSLSLEPPLISLNVARSSSSWPRIVESGRFVVNVLAEGQDDLALTFGTRGTDRFGEVEWTRGSSGLPHLPGCMAWIECNLVATYEGGDHLIAVGSVRDLIEGTTRRPLIFFDREFRKLQ